MRLTGLDLKTSSEYGTHVVVPPISQVKTKILGLVRASVTEAVTFATSALIIYPVIARRLFWRLTIFVAKLFYNMPRSQGSPVGIQPLHWMFLVKSYYFTFLLLIIWDCSNLAFSVLMSQQPLKGGNALTNASKDPTGSLILGLKTKQEVPKSFAFWELMLIGRRFPERRKAIFDGIEREGGASWTQILNASLGVVIAIQKRIDTLPAPEQAIALTLAAKKQEELQRLPRITSSSLKHDSIFTPSPKPSRTAVVMKNLGQSPDSMPNARRSARETIEWSKDSTIRNDSAKAYVLEMLRWPFFSLFRQPFASRVSAVIFGAPYSDISIIIDAIDSVTRLSIASLREDSLGKVQGDVPRIVRTYTTTIQKMQRYLAQTKPHWTDVHFDGSREVRDVDVVVRCLQDNLRELLSAFSLYLEDVGVTGEELMHARAATGNGQEMQQSGK